MPLTRGKQRVVSWRHHRPCGPTEAKRNRRPGEYAVADERGGEEQGSDGVTARPSLEPIGNGRHSGSRCCWHY